MSFLTLDIETVPMWKFTEPGVPVDEKWVQEIPAEHPHTLENYIERAVKNGEAKLKATGVQAALHASTAHVVSVSWGDGTMTDEGKTTVKQWDDFRPPNGATWDEAYEVALLEHTFRSIAAALRKGYMTLVGFNTKGFDLPMLRWRAAILGVEVPMLKWDGPSYQGGPAGLLYPFDNRTHCDLRLLWSNGNKYAKGTLADMSAAFGIENEEHGADVYQWFRDNDWGKLREYGHQEARNLIALYRACERIL